MLAARFLDDGTERKATDSLVIQASTLHSQDEFKKLADTVLFPTFYDEDLVGGA